MSDKKNTKKEEQKKKAKKRAVKGAKNKKRIEVSASSREKNRFAPLSDFKGSSSLYVSSGTAKRVQDMKKMKQGVVRREFESKRHSYDIRSMFMNIRSEVKGQLIVTANVEDDLPMIDQMPGTIEIKQSSPDTYAVLVNIGERKGILNCNKQGLMKIRHDLISWVLTGAFENDVKIIDVYPDSKVEGTHQTPDLTITLGATRHWCEIATTRSHNLSVAEQSKMKYVKVLTDLAKEQGIAMTYSTIIVGPLSIRAPVKFPEVVKRHLANAFALGLKAEEECVSKGWVVDMDSIEEAQTRDKLRELLADAKWKEPALGGKHEITGELLKRWAELNNAMTVEDILKKMGPIILKEASKETTTDMKMNENEIAKARFKKFIDVWNQNPVTKAKRENMRVSVKAVIQIAMLIPMCDYSDGERELPDIKEPADNSSTVAAWHQIASRGVMHHNPVQLEAEAKHGALLEESLSEEKSEKETRKVRNAEYRMKINFNHDTLKFLAQKGFQGKHFKLQNVEIRKESQVPFHPSVDTTDITAFCCDPISPSFWLEKSLTSEYKVTKGWDPLAETHDELRRAGSDDKLNDGWARENVDAILRTRIGRMLLVLGKMTEELNISLSNFGAENEIIFKPIAKGLWLFAKSAGPTRHIYYSVMYLSSMYRCPGLPFKQPEYLDDNIGIFPILSMDRHKLSHILSPESIMSMFFFWSTQFGWRPEQQFNQITMDSWSHFALTFLTWLEDKGPTSNALMQTRYMYFEMLRPDGSGRDPLKILDKIPPFPRSRLEVWIIQRIYTACMIMITNGVTSLSHGVSVGVEEYDLSIEKAEELDVSADSFSGLISIATLREVRSFSTCIVIPYIGACHNKDEGDENQGFFKIFTKVVAEERKMPAARKEYMGYDDLPDLSYKSHEFSASWMIGIGKMIKQEIMIKYNMLSEEMYNDWQIRHMCKEIMKRPLESIATLKASAVFDYIRKIGKKIVGNIDFKEFTINMESNDSQKRIFNRRRKVLETVSILARYTNTGHLPLLNILETLEDLEDQGGVLVNLFKKLQLQGVREIFVLDIYSRISILFMETWSRMMCQELKNEMLTKGDAKHSVVRKHFAKVAEADVGHVIGCQDSDDASTWAQQFIMPAFGCFMSVCCDPKIYIINCRVLNCIANKKLEMATGMLKKMKEYERNPSRSSLSDPEINHLRDDFLGITNTGLVITAESIFLVNQSNMMQGICHYTSSLLHAGHLMMLERMDQICLRVVKGAKNTAVTRAEGKDKYILIETSQCSSDDSEFNRHICCPLGKSPMIEDVLLLMLLSNIKKVSYVLMCARQSGTKSTKFVLCAVCEFNSTWYVKNTIASIPIKFIFAATRLKSTSSLLGRQHNSANLLKQCVENGTNFFVCACLQEFQMRAHYSCLGMNVSILFPDFKSRLLKNPHPSLGLFTCQPELCAGLMGHDIGFYRLYSRNKRTRDLDRIMTGRTDPELSEGGRPNINVFLSMGRGDRHKAFLESLRRDGVLTPDWREIAEKNPSMLLRESRSKEESLFYINKLSMNPLIVEAFSFQLIAKLYASAVYILHAMATSMKESKDKALPEIRKFSLLKIIDQIENDLNEVKLMDIDLLTELKFPTKTFFDQIIDRCIVIGTRPVYAKSPAFSLKIGKVILPKALSAASVSLRDCCNFVWFKEKPRHSVTATMASWEVYKLGLTWLRDDYKSTLENSGFMDVISLMDYIKMNSNSQIQIKFHAPFLNKTMSISKIESVIKCNQVHGYVLKSAIAWGRGLNELNKLSNQLNLILLGPNIPGYLKEQYVYKLLKQANDELGGESTGYEAKSVAIAKIPEKLIELVLVIHILQCPKVNIPSLLLLLKSKEYYLYVKQQHKSVTKAGEVKWHGHGIIQYVLGERLVKFHVMNTNIVFIETQLLPDEYEKQRWCQMFDNQGFVAKQAPEDGFSYYFDCKSKAISAFWKKETIPIKLVDSMFNETTAAREFQLRIVHSTTGYSRIELCQHNRELSVLRFTPDVTFLANSSLELSKIPDEQFYNGLRRPVSYAYSWEYFFRYWVRVETMPRERMLAGILQIRIMLDELDEIKKLNVAKAKDYKTRKGTILIIKQIDREKINSVEATRDTAFKKIISKHERRAEHKKQIDEDIKSPLMVLYSPNIKLPIDRESKTWTLKMYPFLEPSQWYDSFSHLKTFLAQTCRAALGHKDIFLTEWQEAKRINVDDQEAKLTVDFKQVDVSQDMDEAMLELGLQMAADAQRIGGEYNYENDDEDDEEDDEEENDDKKEGKRSRSLSRDDTPGKIKRTSSQPPPSPKDIKDIHRGRSSMRSEQAITTVDTDKKEFIDLISQDKDLGWLVTRGLRPQSLKESKQQIEDAQSTPESWVKIPEDKYSGFPALHFSLSDVKLAESMLYNEHHARIAIRSALRVESVFSAQLVTHPIWNDTILSLGSWNPLGRSKPQGDNQELIMWLVGKKVEDYEPENIAPKPTEIDEETEVL